MAIHVDHIADVSFTNHFLGVDGSTPKNGVIEVNDNTFDVSFDNGRVNARFTTGNWFTNFFRGKTMSRFKQNLQTQYDNWIQEKTKTSAANDIIQDNVNVPVIKNDLANDGIKENANVPVIKNDLANDGIKENVKVSAAKKKEVANIGVKDSPDVAAVNAAVDECFDILHGAKDKVDKTTINCSKDVIKAYGTLHKENGQYVLSQGLNDYDYEHIDHYCEIMPANLGEYAKRLGLFANLASIRNQLANMATGTEIAEKLLGEYGIKTHMDINCDCKSEESMKKYLLDTIDNVLNGFLTAVNAMKDKRTELLKFLFKFDGVCLEAKSDNIQDWLIHSSDDIKESRSTEKDNLAFSVTAEFNAIADDVAAPFREEARKSCEAEVREACKNEGIVDEAAIEQRISQKVDMIVMQKSDEIDPLIHQKIEEDGKFALYDNLVGANRPVTVISKNEETGKWKVTTFVDKDNKPILKPVSAFDIDKHFKQLVAMYKDEAVLMNDIELETRPATAKMGNRNELFAKDVIGSASAALKNDDEFKTLCQRVKRQMRLKLEIPDAEFEVAVKQSLEDITALKDLNSADTELNFSRFVNNYADSSYNDQLSDTARLANLVARRVENRKAYYQSFLADLDAKAGRCAQMLKVTNQNKVVDVKEAQKAIATTLRTMIERVQADPNNPKNQVCKKNLFSLMNNGRLFTDQLNYDMSHRAAGSDEIKLKKTLGKLLQCIAHYGNIDSHTFIHSKEQEVAA